jgi:uracil-DNA glycosylase
VKCPVNNELAGNVDTDAAFDHCVAYLREEINTVDPKVIVALGKDPARQILNGLYDYNIESLRTGSRDAGKTYETTPPVIVSPHWGHGWLGRNNNREKVRQAILDVL